MSSNSAEFEESQASSVSHQISEEQLETTKKLLEINIEDIRRCIGCPIVERCIEKSEDHSTANDLNSAAAYIRYIVQIQKTCTGPIEQPSRIPFKKPVTLCDSTAVRGLSKRLRRDF